MSKSHFNLFYLCSFIVDLNVEHTVVLQSMLAVKPFLLDVGTVSPDNFAVGKIRVEKLGDNTGDERQSHESPQPNQKMLHDLK